MVESNVKITVADPTPLGLFGLGIVTIVASSQKLGLTTGTALIIPWAIFLGSFAQLVACIFDYKRNNIFGATAFGAFGFFWIAVAMNWLITSGAFGSALQSSADTTQLAFAFLGYTIFVLYMTIGAFEAPKILLIIFIFVDILLIALTLGGFGIMKSEMQFIAGLSEFMVAMTSFYGSAAIVLNTHFGRVFLPIGKPFGIFK